MQTRFVFLPFDLFGSAGTGAGVELLADEMREVLADNRREKAPTRARAYTPHVRLRRLGFETLRDYHGWRRQARRVARRVLDRGEFLVWVTGNHLGALPVYDELAGSDDKTLVVQFDAHLDVHQFTGYSPEPSHGNFLLHCDGPLPPLVNVGHRDLLLPAEHVARSFRQTFPAAELALDPDPVLTKLRRLGEEAQRVFVDIDCDVFDPVFFPAVTQPVPFGLDPPLFLRLLRAVWSPKVAGVLLSEFDPGRDRNDQSLALLVWLLEYLLLKRYEELGG